MLERRFAASDGYEFVNAGINGQLAYNLLQRLDNVVACCPDVVTVLIGSDGVAIERQPGVGRHVSQGTEATRKTDACLVSPERRTHHRPSAIRDRRPQIALLDLPMLGEDLASDTNRQVTSNTMRSFKQLQRRNG